MTCPTEVTCPLDPHQPTWLGLDVLYSCPECGKAVVSGYGHDDPDPRPERNIFTATSHRVFGHGLDTTEPEGDGRDMPT